MARALVRVTVVQVAHSLPKRQEELTMARHDFQTPWGAAAETLAKAQVVPVVLTFNLQSLETWKLTVFNMCL